MSSEAGTAEVAVSARGLGKKYKIYPSPFHRIKEGLMFGRRACHTPVWALRGVDFDLPRGKALGIIGSNGAGKSTLLKILAGTTVATEGGFTCNGKVASLLELGTGFHSEFTGRDNIYLNASVMGFTRKETDARIGEIIEFTELGSFIDQPVRVYSSGMVMRLGFSVATAIDPEILIIDEILAVGDLHFQKKCIDRIFDFRRRGRTIIFCSHSMYDVRTICDEVLWIKGGEIAMRGDPLDVTAEYANYERSLNREPNPAAGGDGAASGKSLPWLEAVTLLDRTGSEPPHFCTGQPLLIRMEYSVPPGWSKPINCGIGIIRQDNVLIAAFSSGHEPGVVVPSRPGRHAATIRIERLDLLDGEFGVVGHLYDELNMHVYHKLMGARSLVIKPEKGLLGMLRLHHTWQFERLQ
jgi:ABC-type polysaccharide/polyol phosphate transport system ATPase subunit